MQKKVQELVFDSEIILSEFVGFKHSFLLTDITGYRVSIC